MNKAEQFYRDLIGSLGLVIDDNGVICLSLPNGDSPIAVEGKTLVLPTREVLRAADWNEMVAFHPLSEQPYRGESPVLKDLKRLIQSRLTGIVTTIVVNLMDIAADPRRQAKLKPKQHEMLSLVKDADEKLVSLLHQILNKVTLKGETRLVAIYSKRGGTVNGKKFNRVAVVSSPMLENGLDEGKRTLEKVQLRKKDIPTILNLFEYVLPGLEEGEYNRGSNCMTAPGLHALLQAFAAVAGQLNMLLSLFKDQIEDAEEWMTSLDWLEYLDNFASLRPLIPALEGNDGSVEEPEKAAPTAAPKAASGYSMEHRQPPQAPAAARTEPEERKPGLRKVGGPPAYHHESHPVQPQPGYAPQGYPPPPPQGWPVDQYGNPVPVVYDQQGQPMPASGYQPQPYQPYQPQQQGYPVQQHGGLRKVGGPAPAYGYGQPQQMDARTISRMRMANRGAATQVYPYGHYPQYPGPNGRY